MPRHHELTVVRAVFGRPSYTCRQDAVNEQVKFAVDAGVNFLPIPRTCTPSVSRNRCSERRSSRLGLKREQLIVATKATGSMDDSPNKRAVAPPFVQPSRGKPEAPAARLYPPVPAVHGFDPLTPFEESLSALNDLVRSGKVRYIGLCNLTAWQIMKSLKVSERLNLAKSSRGVQVYYTPLPAATWSARSCP